MINVEKLSTETLAAMLDTEMCFDLFEIVFGELGKRVPTACKRWEEDGCPNGFKNYI